MILTASTLPSSRGAEFEAANCSQRPQLFNGSVKSR